MTQPKKALITGISGQDGSYLSEWLLDKGYEVHGVVHPTAAERGEYAKLGSILNRLKLYPSTLEDHASLRDIVSKVRPDECYHLAAQTFVNIGPQEEAATLHSNIEGTLAMLSALKESAPGSRFFFASSSEMFGRAEESPQNERTRFHPRSVYGVSKAAGYQLVQHYRESAGLFACSGILYNHESPRRSPEFVTRKITSAVARIKAGLQTELRLGSLDGKRDWGHAREYVQAMWMMLQQDVPDDFVIATGRAHSVGDFVNAAFAAAGLNPKDYVRIDPQLVRPPETVLLIGDPSKAARSLGWKAKIGFKDLVAEMVQCDLEILAARPVH
jgi:GDPmannose 4,6-dehydratase